MKKIIFFVCAYQFFSFELLIASDQNSFFTSITAFVIIGFATTQYVNYDMSTKQLKPINTGINFNEENVQDLKMNELVKKNENITKIQAFIRGSLARKNIKKNNTFGQRFRKLESIISYSENSIKTNLSSLTGTTCDKLTPDNSRLHSPINLDLLTVSNYCNQGFGCSRYNEKNENLEDNGYCLVDKNFSRN